MAAYGAKGRKNRLAKYSDPAVPSFGPCASGPGVVTAPENLYTFGSATEDAHTHHINVQISSARNHSVNNSEHYGVISGEKSSLANVMGRAFLTRFGDQVSYVKVKSSSVTIAKVDVAH